MVATPVQLQSTQFAPDAEADTVTVDQIPEEWMGLDVGPKTISAFEEALAPCKTVVRAETTIKILKNLKIRWQKSLCWGYIVNGVRVKKHVGVVRLGSCCCVDRQYCCLYTLRLHNPKDQQGLDLTARGRVGTGRRSPSFFLAAFLPPPPPTLSLPPSVPLLTHPWHRPPARPPKSRFANGPMVCDIRCGTDRWACSSSTSFPRGLSRWRTAWPVKPRRGPSPSSGAGTRYVLDTKSLAVEDEFMS